MLRTALLQTFRVMMCLDIRSYCKRLERNVTICMGWTFPVLKTVFLSQQIARVHSIKTCYSQPRKLSRLYLSLLDMRLSNK